MQEGCISQPIWKDMVCIVATTTCQHVGLGLLLHCWHVSCVCNSGVWGMLPGLFAHRNGWEEERHDEARVKNELS